MLDAIRGARTTIDFETYIYWSGDDRPGVRRCALRAGARRRQGARAARLGRLVEDGPGAGRRDEAARASRSRSTTRRTGAPRPAQQPHAPEAPRRRRPGRLHRRRRHRRQVERRRAGPRPLARHPLPGRRPGRRADAGASSWTTGSRPPARCCTAPSTFRRSSRVGGGAAQVFSSSPSGGSESMELMYLMAITSAKRTIRLSSSYFVPNDLAVRTMVAAHEARREAADHHAGNAHRHRDGARRVAGALGRAARRPAPRSTSTSRRCTTAR